MPHAKKMTAHIEEPEALKKALEKARDERSRMVAKQTVDALTARIKKPLKVKHVGRRTKGAPSVY
jgi:hypothetical protein